MSIVNDFNANYALASDIGGTQIRAAIVDSSGRILIRDKTSTRPDRGVEDAARELSTIMLRLFRETGVESVKGLGVASAGPFRPWSGEYRHPPNLLPWHGKSLKPTLESELGIPVLMGHDATLSAFAETRYGPHKGSSNLVYVTISTGIGGGIVANGKMVTGRDGGAGEIGHILVRGGEYRCNVGCDGCLEGNACGPAIATMARDCISAGQNSAMLKMVNGKISDITSEVVLKAALQGDVVAQSIVKRVIETIGAGIASLLSIFDPDAIYLGGGVAEGLRPWWSEVKESIRRHALPRYSGGVPVALTSLGDDAGLLGAAALIFELEP